MSTSSMPLRGARLAGAALALLQLGATASAATLTVTVEGARSRQGTVRAALFRDAAHWLKPDDAARASVAVLDSVTGDSVTFVYADLSAGRYALSVFQDANGDGKLDTNPAGLPIEPYGFSRDVRGRFGPPSFDDAAIDVQGDQHVTIHLR
ncbi:MULTISPECIES: DUF2141 domain-containing protein [Ralstonia solanacearum species complex]|uniref:DUF2141 domain-containing protein n=1 Tax=Ralstonia solanacearum species complex TaxID=3116862 RepID=UPI0019697FDD|nr:DUF2141 domain-containing protein [Ralstonia solanacearum]BEU73788.1 hypothetical protein MAFF211271_33430 [Ralstonia pseudosolanacearum]